MTKLIYTYCIAALFFVTAVLGSSLFASSAMSNTPNTPDEDPQWPEVFQLTHEKQCVSHSDFIVLRILSTDEKLVHSWNSPEFPQLQTVMFYNPTIRLVTVYEIYDQRIACLISHGLLHPTR